jgi:hypothetical protein
MLADESPPQRSPCVVVGFLEGAEYGRKKRVSFEQPSFNIETFKNPS